MPTYDYLCAACAHRVEVVHGVNELGPVTCPSCGAQGTLRKAFAPPTIVFRGSGWAKNERTTARAGSVRKKDDGGTPAEGATPVNGTSSKAEPAAGATDRPGSKAAADD